MKLYLTKNTFMLRHLILGLITVFALWGLISMFASFGTTHQADIKYQNQIKEQYFAYAFPLPETIVFAGENVPLENFDTRESLDLEIQKVAYWHSELLLYMKRANRTFPIIEPILKKNGIPDDFKYFAVCESGLLNVTSPSGAKGIWQFMDETAKSYNLEVSDEVDERYNLELATEAACKYFKDSYRKYKNWSMVAASYNTGQTNLTLKQKEQNQDNYYDLLLNEETARYVFRTIAIKLVMSEPQNFGFVCRNKDLYPIIHSHVCEIDSSIGNLADFAEKNNTNYKILKFLNPWLRKNVLSNKDKKTYRIAIPEKNARTLDYQHEIENPDSLLKFIDTQ